MSHKRPGQSTGSTSKGSNKSNKHEQGLSRAAREQKKAASNPARPRGDKKKPH